jgi:hypothetical protein
MWVQIEQLYLNVLCSVLERAVQGVGLVGYVSRQDVTVSVC